MTVKSKTIYIEILVEYTHLEDIPTQYMLAQMELLREVEKDDYKIIKQQAAPRLRVRFKHSGT